MRIKILQWLAIIALVSTRVFAANTNPIVTNVTFSITGTTVTVTYDVADAETSKVTIFMNVSIDNAVTWDYNYGVANGAIGAGVTTGTGKTITWTYTGGLNRQVKIKIFANDEQTGGTDCGTVSYGGQTYNTIMIGDKCWFKENLNIGTMINNATGGTNSNGMQTNNNVIEKYCSGNDVANCAIQGGLYQWDETMQYSTTEGTQGICPSGWHIPTYNEQVALQATVNNSYAALSATGTNTSGFTGIMCGFMKYSDKGFWYGPWYLHLWSSTEYNPTTAHEMYLYSYSTTSTIATNTNGLKENGYSVRCIKN